MSGFTNAIRSLIGGILSSHRDADGSGREEPPVVRFMDTPDLFGSGVGSGTYGDVECDVCGGKYNQGEDKRGIYDGDSVGWTSFAGMNVCDCCFGRIEEEIWRRRNDVVSWIALRLKSEHEKLSKSAIKANEAGKLLAGSLAKQRADP